MKEITIVAASDLYINETIKALKVSSELLNPHKTILFTSHANIKSKKMRRSLYRKLSLFVQNQTIVNF